MDYKKHTLLRDDAPAEEYPYAGYSALGPDVCQECGAPDGGMVATYTEDEELIEEPCPWCNKETA